MDSIHDALNEAAEKIRNIVGLPVAVYYTFDLSQKEFNEILNVICAVCEVSPSKVHGRSRKGKTLIARHVFCWTSLTLFKFQSTDIGKYLRKDHSTVLNARRVVNDMIDTNNLSYTSVIDEVKNMLAEKIKQIA